MCLSTRFCVLEHHVVQTFRASSHHRCILLHVCTHYYIRRLFSHLTSPRNGFQQCVGGLIAYGISQVEGAAIKNWQILFTLLGCATFVWGIFVLWWLPDSPMRATCWSEEDRALIAERVRENETGIQNKEFKVCSIALLSKGYS